MLELWDQKDSEPLGASFAGGVAVVFRGLTLEIERDVALLLSIRGCGLDGIHLFAIPEGDLNPEGAIGGERNLLASDGEQKRNITLNFKREPPEDNSNPASEARAEWF